MFIPKQARIAVLVVLLGALGAVLYAQGSGWRLGGAPAVLAGDYQTEESWIVTEIVRDVTEMSSYAVNPSAKPVAAHAELVRTGVYRISANGTLKSEMELDLTARVWDPDRFATIARAVLGPKTPSADARTPLMVNTRLTELTPLRLTRASADISAALADGMSDPSLHASAALTIGAFALRESSRRFDDVRWSLNRMTAHLAMARALADASAPATLDGQIAEAVLLTLANHQAKAMAAIERIEAGADATVALPWTRALRLRMTQQWDLLREPAAATRLEKFEYLRARRSAAQGARSVGDFDTLDVDPTTSADWIRILQASYYGVEEGSFFAQDLGLTLEQDEALAVFNSFPKNPGDARGPNLNARATRCITDGKPQVISWGAWAEFSQRHLAMLVGTVDTYWRLRYGSPKLGEAAGRELELALKDLTMFPLGTTLRRTGVADGDADLARINDAIAVAATSPERLTVPLWSWLEFGAHYEAVRHGMPQKANWFIPASSRMPYGGKSRATESGHPPNFGEFAALAQEAPYDFDLRVAELETRFGDKAPAAQIQAAFGRRLAYDLRAINYAIARFEDAEALPLLEYACGLSPAHCVRLASTLAGLNRPDEAARQYEAAFADPAFDNVAFANDCGWLVMYYFEHNQVNNALAMAERAAGIGSARGVNTLAHLHERLQHWDEAEHFYRAAYTAYGDPSQLLGFLYRSVMVRKQVQYEGAWTELLATVFPDGLQDAPKSLEGPPKRGIIITNDNRRVMKAGFQTGDIIVGLEGFRVDNLAQYYAVNAFMTGNQMKLSLWRGNVFNATLAAPNRYMGIEFRSYPIVGWAENTRQSSVTSR